jgi:4-hydroxy-tetrahydrodipicolinate synthase
MFTPLAADGRIDRTALGRYVGFLARGGVDALFALSSTGEFCAMPWSMQCEMVEATLEAARGRLPVCAGVSTQCLQDSIERARTLAAMGVDAVVSLPPFYFRTAQEEMVEFFSRLADASPVPLLVYNMPFRTQHNLEIEAVYRLRAHGQIIGLKDSVNDLERTRLLSRELAGQCEFTYLHGNERLTLEAASLGAHGCVPSIANLAPAFFCRAFRDAASGAPREDDQRRIDDLMAAFGLFEETPQQSTTLRLMALKAVLECLGVMSAHMAQLAPPLSDAWRAKARVFVESLLAEEIAEAPRA